MDNVIDIEDHKPHVVINAGEQVHVIPRAVLQEIAEGKRDMKDLYAWKDVIPLIVGEWLDYTANVCDHPSR